MTAKDATMSAKDATMSAKDATMSAKDANMCAKDATTRFYVYFVLEENVSREGPKIVHGGRRAGCGLSVSP